MPSQVAEHYALCEAALRAHDRDRWLACLLAPEAARPHLHALYAFNLEVSRVAAQVTQALLGEMRLQFWVDALDGVERGDIRANPTADALLATIETCGLDRELFRELLEARRLDLYYDEPQPDLDALDCYCDLTAGHLFRLAGRIVAGEQASGDAAAPAGRAYALTGLLRALPWLAAEGRNFLPVDLLARHGLNAAMIAARNDTPGLRAAMAELRDRARKNLAETRVALRDLSRTERDAYRLAALPKLYLRQMDKAADPFAPLPEIAQWRRQAALFIGRP